MRDLIIKAIVKEVCSGITERYKGFMKTLGFKSIPSSEDLEEALSRLPDEELLGKYEHFCIVYSRNI